MGVSQKRQCQWCLTVDPMPSEPNEYGNEVTAAYGRGWNGRTINVLTCLVLGSKSEHLNTLSFIKYTSNDQSVPSPLPTPIKDMTH